MGVGVALGALLHGWCEVPWSLMGSPAFLSLPGLLARALCHLSIWASLTPGCSEAAQRAGLGVASSGTWSQRLGGGCRSREGRRHSSPSRSTSGKSLRLVSGRSIMLRMQRRAQAASTTCCRKAPWPMWRRWAGPLSPPSAPSAIIKPRPRPLGEDIGDTQPIAVSLTPTIL